MNPESIKKAYDQMTAIIAKQERILPFNDIYGDGKIYKPLTKQTVILLYDTLKEVTIETAKEQPNHVFNKFLKNGDI